MRVLSVIAFLVFAFSCNIERETLRSSLVNTDKIAAQFYGTTSDSAKLIVWYLEVYDYYASSKEDYYDPFTLNLYGDEYYGPSQELRNSCLIDSIVAGPGNYVFPFDVGHPCVPESSNLQRRFFIQKYNVDSFDYQVNEPYYYDNFDDGTPISAFDSLGYEKDF